MTPATDAYELGLAALRDGTEEAAIPLLEAAAQRAPGDARLWQVLGLLNRAVHELEPALAAFDKAAALAPRDPTILHGLAQCRFEAGLPAVASFERALALAPDDGAVLQGWVAALAAEQGLKAAISALEPALQRRQTWCEGHHLLSRLRSAAGDRSTAFESIAAAARRHPGATDLWRLWGRLLLKQKRFDDALAVAREGQRHAPDRTLQMLEAAALSESGQLGEASRAWAHLGPLQDVESMIYEARHLLRSGRADVIAARAAQVPSLRNLDPLCPYFALAWRMTGDPRLRWLEQDGLVGVYDLAGDLPELAALADLLRRLHVHSDEPLEQSVRLGTQTDGPLLNRIEPQIRALRKAIERAVQTHLRQLPAVDAAHPQLCWRPDRPVRFAGSWSVRLRDAGHHEPHVHPEGWFSSALYVSLPEGLGGAGKAGWLTLGEPQDSLGLGLPPVATIEPRPGRLVLFPSTMWHGTVPFDRGERLTVAFDVARPR